MTWTALMRPAAKATGGGTGPSRTTLAEDGPRPALYIERDDRPTVLVAGPAGQAQTLADWAMRAGFRCIGTVTLDDLAPRLARTVAVDLILADLRGGTIDAATARTLTQRHGLPDARLAVLTDLASVDAAFATLDGPGTDIVCDAGTSDIVSLLVMAALAAQSERGDPLLHDTTRETEAARIEQLSEEVRRLATTIDRLTRHSELGDGPMEPGTAYRTMGPRGVERAEESNHAANGAAIGAGATRAPSHGDIRALLRARRLREQYLPADLFADPAWDMILDLMAARLAGQRVSVSSLCIAASVPPTTALRWIRQLTERGVFSRIDDPADGRRVFIELTDDAAAAFMAWAHAVRRNGGLLPPS